MRKFYFTDAKLRAIKPESKRVEYYDSHLIENGKLKESGVDGFLLRVNPGGSKRFMFYYFINGSNKRVSIGRYPNTSLTDARNEARVFAEQVSNGIDPTIEKLKSKIGNNITLKDYIERFKVEYMARKLKESTRKDYESRLNKVIDSPMAKLPLKDITRAMIRSFIKTEAKTQPVNANRIHSILSKLFNEAVQDELIPENPIRKMPKETSEIKFHRDIEYNADQIRAIWNAIGTVEYVAQRNVLKMLIITGQRLGETSRMEWSDIDFENLIWTIDKDQNKAGRTHKIPLPDMALQVLYTMKALYPDSKLVFPAIIDQSKPISDFSHAIKRIRKLTGLHDFRIHDLRHIVGTGMAENCGIDVFIIEKTLNHKTTSHKITSRYINSDLIEQKTKALDLWTGYLTTLISPLSAVKMGGGA